MSVIGVGDTVTFSISKKQSAVGQVVVIDDDGTAVIFRQGRTYSRPVKDLIKSYKQKDK